MVVRCLVVIVVGKVEKLETIRRGVDDKNTKCKKKKSSKTSFSTKNLHREMKHSV